MTLRTENHVHRLHNDSLCRLCMRFATISKCLNGWPATAIPLTKLLSIIRSLFYFWKQIELPLSSYKTLWVRPLISRWTCSSVTITPCCCFPISPIQLLPFRIAITSSTGILFGYAIWYECFLIDGVPHNRVTLIASTALKGKINQKGRENVNQSCSPIFPLFLFLISFLTPSFALQHSSSFIGSGENGTKSGRHGDKWLI